MRDINRHGAAFNRQFQRQFNVIGYGCAGREIVRGAERQQAERRTFFAAQRGQRRRHFINRAVAACGDHRLRTLFRRLTDIARRIAFFPGHAHLYRVALVTQQLDAAAQNFIVSAFTI